MTLPSSSSVRSIYAQYFNIIDSFFGAIKHYLGKEVDSHIDLGRYIASYPLISDLILDAIDDLDSEIEKFWKENATTVVSFIKAQESLKCLYSGDITPSVLENFIKRSALYVDSVIIPDPIYNLSIFQKEAYLDRKYYLNKLVRHVFNIWKIKDLVLADSQEHILLILPVNLHFVDRETRTNLLQAADEDFLKYVKSLTNQGLETAEESMSFLEKFESNEKLFEQISNKQLLPNQFQNFSSFDKFLTDFNGTGKVAKLDQKSKGWSFGLYVKSQFIRTQEHKLFCDKLVATPLYDYSLPWFFFNYKIGGNGMDYAISNSLQNEKFEWITNLPISAIKKLREEGRLDYMRSCLRNGMHDLKAKNDSDLLKTSEQLEKNFQEVFKRHAEDISCLKNEAENIATDATINAGITTFNNFMSFIPVIGGIVSVVKAGRDVKRLIDQGKKVGKIREKISEKEGDCVSILMEAHDK
jgi:hypothetical protein